MPAQQLFRTRTVAVTVANCVKLEELAKGEGLTETDIINRAIAVYHEVKHRIASGQELGFISREDGKVTQVELVQIIG